MIAATASTWNGNSGTVLDDAEELDVWVDVVDACVVVVGGMEVVEIDVVVVEVWLAVEVGVPLEAEEEKSMTLLNPSSATQRLPAESKAIPSGVRRLF